MKRLTLFVKGNVDVHDSLHSCRIGGQLVWNGVNDVLRVGYPGCLARIKHETWTRSDALLTCSGTVPETLASRQLSLGSYPLPSQFSRALFETEADAIVLSVQPDVTTGLVRHRTEGYLFYASESGHWNETDKEWLKTCFEPVTQLNVSEAIANFTSIIEQIRVRSDAPILIYNLSPVIPGEMIYCHQGMGEIYSTRIRRFNLGLIELSEKTGVSIIDVDALLARKGADDLKLDMTHLTADGYRLIAEEVVRVLGDLGTLDEVI